MRHAIIELRFRIAEWALRGLVAGLCRSYGGTLANGQVRLCDKERWHTDSHTYAVEDAR